MFDRVKLLARPVPSVGPETACGQVYELFSADSELLSIAVCVDGRPVGLTNRHELTLRLADRFGRALFEDKPISRLMDDKPLIVEANVYIDLLNRLIVDERPNALNHGFIVVEDGKYFGVGSALSLLQANIKWAKLHSAELEKAKIEAETANRSKSMFLANMSHELRTPLNAIIGFTDFINTETLGPIKPAKYGDYVRDVNESGRHLLNVINALLDMSKIEAGRLELKEDYVDCDETIWLVVRMLGATIERYGVSVAIDVAKDMPDIFADSQLIRQILVNLLSNAIKYSEAGTTITISAKITEDGRCRLAVEDQGYGIAPGDMMRVMEPFGQADVTLARRAEGTGLGLPLVKALTEAHGGTFNLSSELNVGTLAVVLLPADRVIETPDDLPDLDVLSENFA